VNGRFAEYATSGAFAVTLTRSQIQSLGFVLGTGGAMYSHGTSLERKGLVEPPGKLVGTRIAIHAGARKIVQTEVKALLARLASHLFSTRGVEARFPGPRRRGIRHA